MNKVIHIDINIDVLQLILMSIHNNNRFSWLIYKLIIYLLFKQRFAFFAFKSVVVLLCFDSSCFSFNNFLRIVTISHIDFVIIVGLFTVCVSAVVWVVDARQTCLWVYKFMLAHSIHQQSCKQTQSASINSKYLMLLC